MRQFLKWIYTAQLTFDLLGDKVVTRGKANATKRIAAVKKLGFVLPKNALKGNASEVFDYYYVLHSDGKR